MTFTDLHFAPFRCGPIRMRFQKSDTIARVVVVNVSHFTQKD